MTIKQQSYASENYSPLYFLASLGAGGMAVTFFMYLMFWVPHKGRPVPVFEDIASFWTSSSVASQVMIALAVTGIAVFAVLHYALLIWNFRQLPKFKGTEGYQTLHQTNAETQLKAVPLTLAMSVNTGFIVGLVFVPGLWSIVEYLFPLAILAFLAIGVFAFRLFGRFLGRVLDQGGFSHAQNNSFAQLLPAFSFAMVAVGLAAPAAMSTTAWVVGTSLALSTFFAMTAVLITVIALVLALNSMLQHGVAREAAPTLLIVVPILTVLGIAALRMDHGLHTTFEAHSAAADTFVFLTRILAVQLLFGLFGLLVLSRQHYAEKYLSDDGTRSPGSYALVCPGVALSVMIQFWVNKGLLANGLIEKFSVFYWGATAPALIAQVAMIALLIRLHRLHFSTVKPATGPLAPSSVH